MDRRNSRGYWSRPSPRTPTAPRRARPDPHRDLWQRMRAGFSMPDLPTPLVQEKERFYLSKPEALQRMFARGGRYLHYIVEEVEKRGMPTSKEGLFKGSPLRSSLDSVSTKRTNRPKE